PALFRCGRPESVVARRGPGPDLAVARRGGAAEVSEARRHPTRHAESAPTRPVQAHDADLDIVPLHGPLQRRQCLPHGEAQDALALKSLAQLGAPGEVANLAEVAPVDGERGQAAGAAIPGDSVEEGVCRRVVALAGVAEDAR